MKFYICKHCGNVIVKLTDSQVPVVCCGEPMQELHAGVTDAAVEKHVPMVTETDNQIVIQVGSVLHPMTQEHYIEWIVLEYEGGFTSYHLNPGDEPKVTVLKDNQKLLSTYAYCNLHGLWKK